MGDSIADAKYQYVEALLGIVLTRPAPAPKTPSGNAVQAATVEPRLPAPPGGAAMAITSGQARSGAPVKPAGFDGPASELAGAGGKKMQVRHASDGRVQLTAPPPPIREVTFSGGGGKGAALPGAVKALEASGILKDVKVVTGASVGSMTAALVAAGITASEFTAFGNDPSVGGKITEGGSMPSLLAKGLAGKGLKGAGLEDLMRTKLDETLRKRILEYQDAQFKQNLPIDDGVKTVRDNLVKSKRGPTFLDLRLLSQAIPAIKEVVIPATCLGQVDPKTGQPKKGSKPETKVFSADTEPGIEVALVVHASAALPPVFDPVPIRLGDGTWCIFEDGGVLNNTPTLSSLGTERDVDPVSDKGHLTFVFEGEDGDQVKKGTVAPHKQTRMEGMQNDLTKADNAAAELEKNMRLAADAENVVEVPLKFDKPLAKSLTTAGKKILADKMSTFVFDMEKYGVAGLGVATMKEFNAITLAGNALDTYDETNKDFSGLRKGTVNFNISAEDKSKLQELTEKATSEHLTKRKPQTMEFASDAQMFLSISRADLAALAADKGAEKTMKGAAAALQFRDAVAAGIKALARHAGGLKAGTAAQGGGNIATLDAKTQADVEKCLAGLDALAGQDHDRQAYVGREMNRTGDLDALLATFRDGTCPSSGSLEAGLAVADALEAQNRARQVLHAAIYPWMKREDPQSPNGIMLKVTEAKLHRVPSTDYLNDKLSTAAGYFRKHPERPNAAAMAAELEGYVLH